MFKLETDGELPNFSLALPYAIEGKLGASFKSPVSDERFFREHIAGLVRSQLRKNSEIKIWDIGCGTLDWFEDLCKPFYNSLKNGEIKVLGTDLSRELMKTASSRINKVLKNRDSLPENALKLRQEDFHKSETPDNSQNLIIATNVAIYSPAELLKTMYDKLKPGGRAVVNFRTLNHLKSLKQRPNSSARGMINGYDFLMAGVNRSNGHDLAVSETKTQWYLEDMKSLLALVSSFGFKITKIEDFVVGEGAEAKASWLLELQK